MRPRWGWGWWGLGGCWQEEPPREEGEGHIHLLLCIARLGSLCVHLEKGLYSRTAAPSERKDGFFFFLVLTHKPSNERCCVWIVQIQGGKVLLLLPALSPGLI